MQVPLELSLRDVTGAKALEREIRRRVTRLERACDRIQRCRVAVEGPFRPARKGPRLHVRIDVTVPGRAIVVKRPARSATEDLLGTVADAFRAARRELQDYAAGGRTRTEPVRGRVLWVDRAARTGLLASSDGGWVSFDDRVVLDHAFDEMESGDAVCFEAEPGPDGLEATTVWVVGRRAELL